MKLLHVIASPRHKQSNTMEVSDAFVRQLQTHRSDLVVEVVDLYDYDLPAIAGDNIEAKYTLMMGRPIDKNHEESWREIETLIGRFLAADAYLITAPMWNLSIPYALKYYIDCIIQPGYVFRYNELGQVEPMVHGRKMVCITSRGGDYGPGTPMQAYDFQEPYLRAIFGFIGVIDIEFISAQPMDTGLDIRHGALATAIAQAEGLASSAKWAERVAADA